MNKDVNFILRKLRQAGHEAYLVGGCVRDKLMGRNIQDYDICSSALPQEVNGVFKDYQLLDIGLKHGVSMVILNDICYEITTFRADGDYSDGRHPDEVKFVKDIREDLRRRDFTMNAIAFDGDNYVDLFGGMKDINNKIIRCVGDANIRFQEDALRILRAMRFASQLNFVIDDDTKRAMHMHKHLIKNVSSERITVELQKILLGKGVYDVLHEFKDIIAVIIPEFEACFGFSQKNDWHVYDVYEHIIHSVQNVDSDIILRLSMLFHDIGKPQSFSIDGSGKGHFYGHDKLSSQMSIDIMRRLKFEKEKIDKVSLLIKYHDRDIVASKKSVRKLFSEIGSDAAINLLKVKCADKLAQNKDMVSRYGIIDIYSNIVSIANDILKDMDCFDRKHLAISGSDLKDLGLQPSPLYAVILDDVLDKVISDILSNDKDNLLDYVRSRYFQG